MIEVGDKIRRESPFGVSFYTVHRVTKTRAFVRYNEHAEGCFSREVGGFGPRPIPQPKWSRVRYEHIPK